MSDTDSQDSHTAEKRTSGVVHGLLAFGVLTALFFAYFAFIVLPREWLQTDISGEGLPATYQMQPAIVGTDNVHTAVTSERPVYASTADWRVLGDVAAQPDGRHIVRVTVTSLTDAPLLADEFIGTIVQTGSPSQLLPGTVFSETGKGIYTATVTLPDNGEWEIRATVRRGNDTMALVQQIRPLLSR